PSEAAIIKQPRQAIGEGQPLESLLHPYFLQWKADALREVDNQLYLRFGERARLIGGDIEHPEECPGNPQPDANSRAGALIQTGQAFVRLVQQVGNVERLDIVRTPSASPGTKAEALKCQFVRNCAHDRHDVHVPL